MNCPQCQNKAKCLDTRTYQDPNDDFEYVQRRRECLECGERFTTVEVLLETWTDKTND
jgi:transcriptional repressor NrdR